MPSKPRWDLVSRNSGGSVYSNSNASDSGSIVVRDHRPRVHFEMKGTNATFTYKGPDGSETTDKALEIALIMAMEKKKNER